MKRVLFILGALLATSIGASAQFELACASGTTPLLSPTYNPNTQKYRAWVCVDALGFVSSPVFGTGTGTVTSISVVNSHGVSATITNPTTTPALTFTLGVITPTSTNGVSANTMAFMDATSSVQGQLNLLAPLASPVFTGVPVAPTAAAATNTTQLSTTAFVESEIPLRSAVTSVFTRNGAVVAASGDYSVAQVTGAAPSASPTFTGTITLPGLTTLSSIAGSTFISIPAATQLNTFDTGGDAVKIGPSTTVGVELDGASGSTVVMDCTDAGCPTPLSGILLRDNSGSASIQIGPTTAISITGTTAISNLAKPAQVVTQATAGTFGLPVVVGSSTLTARTTLLGTTTVYTVGAATQSLAVHAIVNCDTSVATATATLTIIYTDSSNTAITTTGTGALCTTLGVAAQQSINLPLIRAKNATVVSWAIAIANSPNFDASIQIERYQ